MTCKPSILIDIREYFGTDSIIIGNGSSLPIVGIGDSIIKQENTKWCFTCPWFDKKSTFSKLSYKTISYEL